MPFFPSLPEDATSYHIFTSNAGRFQPFQIFTDHIMRGESVLSTGERELIGAYISGLNGCSYCAGGHIAAARAFGIEPSLLEDVLNDIDNAAIEERLKPILHYVRKLTKEQHLMVQADADAVFAAGWDEAALGDAITVCCLFNFMNRLVDGYGIEADESKFDERGKRHAELGYAGQFNDND